ncbi:uncharacterized protein SCHCODRAFT_02268940 [Schizophyllum commune H4-8]|uniref:uncharacterized protein n=1 Tax=Schizophyllum commune (strain H4-8 / FGSC 9210) TaxID=578458 RepID=UPI00215DD555|nr:uncharacterized protein SCHCODRAFT_02268940 [Schizophyllum commune H4-8]KAI5894080.1 hypothetical protein SCHCODRAFT_02268940 [Schizophyllum commune H4-8]
MSGHYYTVIWLVGPVRAEVRYEANLNEFRRNHDTCPPRGNLRIAGIHIITGEKCTGYVTRSTSTTRRKTKCDDMASSSR